MKSVFTCPVCGKTLIKSEKNLKCDKNHNFDISSKGYVNLLLSNKMNAKLPGDNKLMVNARRDFLSKDYYRKLADKLCETVCRYFKGGVLLDAGCGEGYYTSLVSEALEKAGVDAHISGIDISKTACACAAGKCRNAEIAAASIFHIPMSDNSADMMITLFAPFCESEFRRIISKDGYMIMVIPSENHLWELKEAVYDEPYPNKPHGYEIDGFEFVEKELVEDRIYLPCTKDIENLFSMTPYYYKTGVEGHERVRALKELETRIGFEILTYRKK